MQNIEERPIVIPKATMDALLKLPNAADDIALYNFYYYTAIWQKTNQPKCTTNYVAKALKWSLARVRRSKKELKSIDLVDDIRRLADDKSVAGWYLQVKYIWTEAKIKEKISHPMGNPQGGESHRVEITETNALSSNKVNALSSNTLAKKQKEINPFKDLAKTIPPEKKWVEDYSRHIGFDIDADAFLAYYGARDWMLGKSKVKDWQCCIQTWRSRENARIAEEKKRLVAQGGYDPDAIPTAEELYESIQKSGADGLLEWHGMIRGEPLESYNERMVKMGKIPL